MNIFRKTVLISLLTAGVLASCSSGQSTPTVSQADKMETAISTASTALAETQRGMPTATANVPAALLTLTARPTATDSPMNTQLPRRTPTPTRTSPPPSPTSTSIPLSERIVYYYIEDYPGPNETVPEGTVRVGFSYFIAPIYADEPYTSDTAADLRTALEIALGDPRNLDYEFEPEIVDVTFRSGHAQVQLQAEYFIGTPNTSRDVFRPFTIGRMLILLTVFANPAVQTATIWLNEDTIANLAISDGTQTKPKDYVFTRAEIETYLKEQTYMTPTPTPTPTPLVVIDPSLSLPELPPNAIELRWITAYDLSGDQFVTKIHPTKDGGFILVGNSVSGNRYRALLFKLRADGLIVWQRSLPQVRALDVLETSAGDFILAGDLHWIRLDSQGEVLLQRTFGEPSYHTGPILRLVEESNGNILVEALGSRTVFNADGEPGSITEYNMQWDSQTYPDEVRDRSGQTLWVGGGDDFVKYWVGKADLNNGWLKIFWSPDYGIEPLLFIKGTADGGAILGVPQIYYPDSHTWLSYVLISRLSEDGSVRWQNNYDSNRAASHENFHVFETRSGDLIIAGTLVDFGEGGDVWMARLDKDGNSRWVKMYGTQGQNHRQRDAVAVIQELSNGDLIFAGHTNRTGTGDQDMWILKTNAQGEIPNCGYALDEGGGEFGGDSPEIETIALEGVSLIERETIPSVEEEQTFSDANAQVIPLCSPSP